MDDRLDARVSTSVSETKRNFKTGGCIGGFSKLLDWSRVLGNTSLATKFLVIEVADFSSTAAARIDKRATAKPIQRDSATQASRYGHEKAAHGRRGSAEVSLAQIAGINIMAWISPRRHAETRKELRQLLHVRQEPFVLQESIQEKWQQLKKLSTDAKVRTCVKANHNGEQRKRSQKSQNISICKSRKYEGAETQSVRGLKQPKPSAQRIKRAPAESIVAQPSSKVRAQFTKKSLSSPTKSSSKAGSPVKSPVNISTKKALLMEAAAKILDGRNRSRKPLATLRSLLGDLENRHALLESATTNKSFKSKLVVKSSSCDHSIQSKGREEDPFGETRSNVDEKNRVCFANGSKSKQSCQGTEEGGMDHGKFAQRLDKDSNSQSKVFPYDRSSNNSGKTSASLASPGESVQKNNSLNQPVGIDFFSDSLLGSGREREGGDADEAVDSIMKDPENAGTECASIISFLEESATAEDLSAESKAEGRRIAARLPDKAQIHDQFVELDACGMEALSLCTCFRGKASTPHLNPNTVDCFEPLPSDEQSHSISFANVSSELSDTEGHSLQTNQCMESTALDYKFCQRFASDTRFPGKEVTFEGFEESEPSAAHEKSTKCGEGTGFAGDFTQVGNLEMERTQTDMNDMFSVSCLPPSLYLLKDIDEDRVSSQAGLHQLGRLDGSLLIEKFPTILLKLCDFSWWDKENNHERNSKSEEDQKVNQELFESFDQSPQDSEEDNSSTTSTITHRSLPHSLNQFEEDRDDTILEEEPPLSVVESTCIDELEQLSPVSILDASFEPDSPVLDEPLACFQDARQKLLENVRRYELLAQMDLEALLKYSEVDSSVEEEEDSSHSVLGEIWDGDKDAANEPIVTSEEPEIFSMVSPDFNSILNECEEDTLCVKRGELVYGDESTVGCFEPGFEQNNLISKHHCDTKTQAGFVQEAEGVDMQSTQCLAKRLNLIARLEERHSPNSKIFFDCVADGTNFLVLGVPKDVETHAWIKAPTKLLQELQKPVFSLSMCLVDALLERDTRCGRGRWKDVGKEVEEVGIEIESILFELLMHELFAELMERL